MAVPASLRAGSAGARGSVYGDGGSIAGGGGGGSSYVVSNARAVIEQSRAAASARVFEAEAKEAEQVAASAVGGVARHENYGKVPDYIKATKKQLADARAAVEAAAAEKAKNVPPGMVLMSDEQRVNTLKVLQENHTKVLNDLSAFPLRVETVSRIRAKAALEAKLAEIEKAITVFSRKRVLVQP